MVTRAQQRAYVETFYEDQTQETVASMAPMQFSDEFIGAGHTAGIPAAGAPVAGYPWVKKIVGSAPPTVAIVSNAAGGVVQCALTATSEAEEASMYWNDSLAIDVTKIGDVEFRAQLAVLPSATGVVAALGLGTAFVGGPLNLARYMLFAWSGNGALTLQTKDGLGNTVSQAAAPIGGTAITTDTAMHLYRINFENPADIAFLVDGSRVNAVGSIAFAAVSPNSILQPWMSVYKPSGTGVASLDIDKIDIFTGR